jgi:hypothetical protein
MIHKALTFSSNPFLVHISFLKARFYKVNQKSFISDMKKPQAVVCGSYADP